MTAAVRPASESAPQLFMMSAATAVAAPPLTGRRSARGTVSGGTPIYSITGSKSADSASNAPDARSMYTAGNSTINVGSISLSVVSPCAAPRQSAGKTSAPDTSACMPTAARISGTASSRRILKPASPSPSPSKAPRRRTRRSLSTQPAECQAERQLPRRRVLRQQS